MADTKAQPSARPSGEVNSPPPVSVLRLVSTLTLVAMVSATVLVGGNRLTRRRIEQNHARRQSHGLTRVLPSCTNDPVKDAVVVKDSRGRKATVFRCKQKVKGQTQTVAIAVAIDSTGNRYKPYSGTIQVMVGIDVRTGRVRRGQSKQGPEVAVVIVKHTETPGLGSKIEDFTFRKAFAGQDLKGRDRTSGGKRWAVKKDDAALGLVDAISGATISSRAVTELVLRALQLLKDKRHAILEGKATGPVTPPPVLTPRAPGAADPRQRQVAITAGDLRRVLPPCHLDPRQMLLRLPDSAGRPTIVYQCFQRRSGGRHELVAVAISRSSVGNRHKPYGGLIQVLVAVDARTGRVSADPKRTPPQVGVLVLKHSETQDLGSQIADYDFLKVFAGRDLRGQDKTTDGKVWAVRTDRAQVGFVDALAGATISSAAVTELVQGALALWNQHQALIRVVPAPGEDLFWDFLYPRVVRPAAPAR